MTSRRPLYTEAYVARLLNVVRAQVHVDHFETMVELKRLRNELAEVRGQFEALCNAVRERQRAEADLEMLRKDRDRRMAVAEGKAVWLH
jgi:hypothetical protein